MCQTIFLGINRCEEWKSFSKRWKCSLWYIHISQYLLFLALLTCSCPIEAILHTFCELINTCYRIDAVVCKDVECHIVCTKLITLTSWNENYILNLTSVIEIENYVDKMSPHTQIYENCGSRKSRYSLVHFIYYIDLQYLMLQSYHINPKISYSFDYLFFTVSIFLDSVKVGFQII